MGGDAVAMSMKFLREYVATEQWHTVKDGDDYRIFGTLYLSHLRAAVAEFDTLKKDYDALHETICHDIRYSAEDS